MGLQKNIELPSGILIENSYIRIDEIIGNKDSLVIKVAYYVSKETAENNKPCLKWDSHYFVPFTDDDATNFIKQGYEYLKKLDEFKDATDC